MKSKVDFSKYGLLVLIIVSFLTVVVVISIPILIINLSKSPSKVVIEEPKIVESAEDELSEKYLIDIEYDYRNNPIQKTVFDKETGYTYVYTFTYNHNAHGFACTGSSVIVIDNSGKIVSK